MEYKFDIQQLAEQLSFLVDKVVMFKDSDESVCVVKITSISVERTMDGMHANVVLNYSNGTQQRIKSFDKFKELIMVDNSYVKDLKSILDDNGTIEF